MVCSLVQKQVDQGPFLINDGASHVLVLLLVKPWERQSVPHFFA